MTVLENLRKEYPYLYETHLHTSEASACAGSTGKEMAQACKDAGYTGIIVTNHNWHGNHCIDPSLPWKKWIREYYRGYEEAGKWGEKSNRLCHKIPPANDRRFGHSQYRVIRWRRRIPAKAKRHS